jgi:ABC-type polysaccharide transport system permease subunit
VDFGFSTAVGLFRSVVNFGLLVLFNSLAKRLGESSLF